MNFINPYDIMLFDTDVEGDESMDRSMRRKILEKAPKHTSFSPEYPEVLIAESTNQALDESGDLKHISDINRSRIK